MNLFVIFYASNNKQKALNFILCSTVLQIVCFPCRLLYAEAFGLTCLISHLALSKGDGFEWLFKYGLVEWIPFCNSLRNFEEALRILTV